MKIYLMVIDGAGKSTICDYIKREFEKQSECNIVWARYQPRLVKFLVSPFRKKKVKSSKDFNNMTSEDYSAWTKAKKEKIRKHPILATILFWIQNIEYNCQIFGVISKNKQKHLIVDRYVLDFIVDQTINYGDISKSFPVKMLLRKVRKFDVVLFVNVDSEVAFRRKKDIPSLEYLDERRNVYLNYVKKLPNAVCVNNNGIIDDTIQDIKKALGL